MLKSYVWKTFSFRHHPGCLWLCKRACSTTATPPAIETLETEPASPTPQEPGLLSGAIDKVRDKPKRQRRVLHQPRSRPFVDWKKVHLVAGKGGSGRASFMNTRQHNRGPHGGDGGDGGDILVKADSHLNDLNHIKGYYRAKQGVNGRPHWHRGKTGSDITLCVPVGTTVTNMDTNVVMADLIEHDQVVTLLHGGLGGLGNDHFKSPTHVRPREFTEGEIGEEAVVEIELKSIADIGLVGFPNAGKSTLLSALSRAKPKIADYPFTTLKPNLGVIMYDDETRVTVADIPGLIEGAHANKGLGHVFLRHVERCHGLIYVVDFINNDGLEQYGILKQELDMYSETLTSMPSLFVANKMDLDRNSAAVLEKIQCQVSMPVIDVSAKYGHNIDKLKELILKLYRS